MKRKDYLYIFLLIMIPLLFLFIITSQNLLFGNKVDWFNQHITIADALRHAIREEGTIFPTYLSHLMWGVIIYYFCYYVCLRFDVLLWELFINDLRGPRTRKDQCKDDWSFYWLSSISFNSNKFNLLFFPKKTFKKKWFMFFIKFICFIIFYLFSISQTSHVCELYAFFIFDVKKYWSLFY